MISKIIFITFTILLCISTGPVGAQMFIGEGKVSLTVSGGDRINKNLTLYNNSGDAYTVRVYWEDFEYKPPYDGNKRFMPAGTGKRSASQWITFSPQEFKIDSFGKQVIDYSLSIPSDIDEGGFYGVLFFEKAPEQLHKTDYSGVNIVTRVGCLFFIEPTSKSKKATVLDLSIERDSLIGNFSNQGNVILIPRITYFIVDKDAMVKDRGEIKKLYVPPGANANWRIPLISGLDAGTYTMVVNLDLQEGDVLVKEVDLMIDSSGNYTISAIRD